MKKTIPAILLAAVFLFTTAAFAASGPSSGSGKIGLIIYLLGPDEEPLGDATLLLQENLDAGEAYEGLTDAQGILMIPSFPLTGFVMAARDKDDKLAGLIDVTLYPGAETRIMNNPRSDTDVLSLDMLRSTRLSEHINGAAPLELTDGADEITMYHYEVQVSSQAGGLGALFKVGSQDLMTLEGVSDGAPGAVIPEPTLPPDVAGDDGPSSVQTPSASAQTPSPSAAPSPSVSETPVPSAPAAEETVSEPADPTGTSGEITASPEPTQSPAPTQSAAPTESATVQPTQPPASPSPTSAPTTAADLVNVKLFLKNSGGAPCAYYRTRLNDAVDAMANGEGEAYYTNVTTGVTHELVVYNTEGTEVGSCGLRFVEGSSTSLASVNTGGTYTIDFQSGTQDVYVELVVEPETLAPAEASSQPIQTAGSSGSPGTTSSSGDSGSAGTSEQAQGSEDVIGTPILTPSAAGPTLNGYFSDEEGVAIAGATIRLRNEDTKALSSAITTTEGTFTISQLPPGNYSIGALSAQGRSLGEVSFTAARGGKTKLKTSSNGTTYLSEGQGAQVYLDLRELPNGSLGMLYASNSPMAAPVVAGADTPASAAVGQVAVPDNISMENLDDTTIVEEPVSGNSSQGMIWLVCGLCAAGVLAAALIIRRRAGIK